MEAKLKIGIAEDHSALRKRLIEHFRFFDDADVTLAAGSGDLFLERLALQPADKIPDVVLMDIEMPGMSGIDATYFIKERHPEIDVLMFTVFEDDERIFDAIQAGASGYLLKDEPADVIYEALKGLKNGGAPMSASVARKMLGIMRRLSVSPDAVKQAPSTETPFALSEREVEILQYLVEGKTNSEIGKELFLSPFTIKTHIKNIYKKMHVHNRAEVTKLALKRNLV